MSQYEVFAVLHVLMALLVSAHAVLKKDDPRSAVGWVGLIWLSPFIGAIVYYIFGINRIRRKAVRVMGREDIRGATRSAARAQMEARGLAHLAPLALLGERVGGLPLTPGNAVTPMVNGDEAYPQMLAAIAGARVSVMLSSYIFDRDEAGAEFVAALKAAHERGVEVRVLVDATGSRYSFPSIVPSLKKAGLTVARFMPNLSLRRVSGINLRSHRKLLIIDGTVGFTGGMNIRASNYVAKSPANPVQDLHFRVEGPVVAHLRQAFVEDWVFTTREVLRGETWLPPLAVGTGDVLARGILDGPDSDFEKILWTMLGAVAAAKHSVKIITPYFLPDATMTRFFSVAALAGIDVEIILPAHNNILLVQWAARAALPPLLSRHCRVYLSPPPFDHSKMMIVDDQWVLFGSANWDARSLQLNFEFNIECYDQPLAARLNQLFEAKKANAKPLTWEDLARRSLPERLLDGVTRLAAPYL